MRLVFILSWLVCGIAPAFAESLGPDCGSLVIVGGGRMDAAIVKEFIQRAGGVDAPFVIIPTANLGEDWGDKYVAAWPKDPDTSTSHARLMTRTRGRRCPGHVSPPKGQR